MNGVNGGCGGRSLNSCQLTFQSLFHFLLLMIERAQRIQEWGKEEEVSKESKLMASYLPGTSALFLTFWLISLPLFPLLLVRGILHS